jgi:hypothetical protein
MAVMVGGGFNFMVSSQGQGFMGLSGYGIGTIPGFDEMSGFGYSLCFGFWFFFGGLEVLCQSCLLLWVSVWWI